MWNGDQIIPNRIKHENTEVYGVLLTCNGIVLLVSLDVTEAATFGFIESSQGVHERQPEDA